MWPFWHWKMGVDWGTFVQTGHSSASSSSRIDIFRAMSSATDHNDVDGDIGGDDISVGLFEMSVAVKESVGRTSAAGCRTFESFLIVFFIHLTFKMTMACKEQRLNCCFCSKGRLFKIFLVIIFTHLNWSDTCLKTTFGFVFESKCPFKKSAKCRLRDVSCSKAW